MGRALLRLLGLLVGGSAASLALTAAVFRIDTGGELDWILQVDVGVGLALAVAVMLVRIPAAGAGTWRRHGRTTLAGLLIGAAVAGGLGWSHLEQYRIRSTPPDGVGGDRPGPTGRPS